MKLSTIEKVLLALTAIAVAFLSGFYLGRNNSGDALAVQTSHGEPQMPAHFAQPQRSNSDASATPTVPSAEDTAATQINLNTATKSELLILPGVGEVLAERIIQYRTVHGAFSTIEEIKQIDGIGDVKFDSMKEYITVG